MKRFQWRINVSQRYIYDGGLLPRGWGVAWWEADRICWVIMPIPFNVAAGLIRRGYWAVAHNRWSRTKRDKELDSAYRRGITHMSSMLLDEMARDVIGRMGRN